jgi:hypothetical protein
LANHGGHQGTYPFITPRMQDPIVTYIGLRA